MKKTTASTPTLVDILKQWISHHRNVSERDVIRAVRLAFEETKHSKATVPKSQLPHEQEQDRSR